MIAIIIMCHQNEQQVQFLIQKCIHDKVHIFIHIDKKTIFSDNFYDFVKKQKNVHLIKRRLSAKLFSKELVQIPLLAIKSIKSFEKNQNIHFTYYCLLSGQDCLVKNISYIVDQLKKSYPKPYIDCTPYNNNNWMYEHFNHSVFYKKITNLCTKYKNNKPLYLVLRKIKSACSKISNKNTIIFNLTKLNIKVYGGSEWWILPDILIDYIFNEYIKRKPYIKYLLYDGSPDETFFQTVAMKSKYSNLIEVNGWNKVRQNSKTYAFFYDSKHPFKGHPYNIDLHMTIKLHNDKNYFFARKYDLSNDKELYQYLLNI